MAELRGILIVDDDASVLFVMSAALRTLGVDLAIEVAHNGREALREIEEHPFELVITDLKMPDVDGVQLTEAIRAQRTDTRVIWVTAYGHKHLSEASRRLGVYRCLDKPVRIGHLRQIAREALAASTN